MGHRLSVRTGSSVAAGLILVAFLASPACAATIFDSLAQPSSSWADVWSGWMVCQGFEVGAVDPLTGLQSVTLDMGESAGTGTFVVSIYDDLAGAPGALLTNLVGEAAPNLQGQYTYTPSGPLPLDADTTYYAVASVTGGTDAYAWNWIEDAAPAVGSGMWGYDDGFGWLMFPDFPMRMRVDTEVVPEPATGLLMGLGLVGLAAARRRRR